MYAKLQVMISLESTPDSAFHTDAVKFALIGLMRDLRGIAMATNRFSPPFHVNKSYVLDVKDFLIAIFDFRSSMTFLNFCLLASVAEHTDFYLIGCIPRTCPCF